MVGTPEVQRLREGVDQSIRRSDLIRRVFLEDEWDSNQIDEEKESNDLR